MGQERNRIIERNEMKTIRAKNLREGTASKMLENAPKLQSPSKKKVMETDSEDL